MNTLFNSYITYAIRQLSTAGIVALSINTLAHADGQDWFVRSHLGLSQMTDISGTATNLEGTNGNTDIALDTGFTAGLGIGYRYNRQWAAELSWEYRSNDSATTLSDGTQFEEGNYASNVFFANGFYYLPSFNKGLTPYVGAGLAWVQEVDIDLEANGEEISYSAGGDLGWQAFAGLEYALSSQWSLQAEARYQSITDIELTASPGSVGNLSDMDYQPMTLQAAVRFDF